MARIDEGTLSGTGLKIGIVVARFNDFVTRSLLDGALSALRRHGVAEEDIHVVWVPGAFEIPVVAQQMAQSGQYHALVCLGAVIRGATPHFDYVASEAAAPKQATKDMKRLLPPSKWQH